VQEYIDTSALIALSDARDTNHQRAVEHLREATKSGKRFTVGKPVLVEFLDGLTKRVGKKEALSALDALTESKVVTMVDDTGPDWERCLEIFRRYQDTAIDLTDSLSFAIMERLRIETAFTFDSDFKAHGWTVQP